MAKKKQLRILFDDADYSFMSAYKEAYFVSMQDFIEEAVKDKIQLTKMQIQLNEK